jgi:hypothetical protein
MVTTATSIVDQLGGMLRTMLACCIDLEGMIEKLKVEN